MATKQSARAATPGQRNEFDPSRELPGWPGGTLDAMSRASKAYSSGFAAIGEEMASFMQTRLQHNIALGESLARCHTLTDVAKLQRDWLQETTEEYAAEAQKLMELGSSLMRETLTPVEQAAAEAVAAQVEESKQA